MKPVLGKWLVVDEVLVVINVITIVGPQCIVSDWKLPSRIFFLSFVKFR